MMRPGLPWSPSPDRSTLFSKVSSTRFVKRLISKARGDDRQSVGPRCPNPPSTADDRQPAAPVNVRPTRGFEPASNARDRLVMCSSPADNPLRGLAAPSAGDILLKD